MFSFKKLIEEKKRPLVMGILNITPDSFSDGGKNIELSHASERISQMEAEGADIIDIGACSTAPMNTIAPLEEELSRLAVLPQLAEAASVPLSIDTFRPQVAQFALENGVSIINDESGEFSRNMAELVQKFGAGWIFMHTGGKTSKETVYYENGVVSAVRDFFRDMKKFSLDFGVNEEGLCYDFGIGFGKTRQEDLELLGSCEKFSEFSPLLAGVSRKRVIGEATGKAVPKDRIFGSVAAAAVCAYSGAQILRVHDVGATVDAIKTVESIKKGFINGKDNY